MVRLSLPSLDSLSALGGGPDGGWLWTSEDDLIEVSASRPVLMIEPVAAAMLASWATHQRQRSRKLVIEPSLQSPEAFRTGLLTTLAARPHVRKAEPNLLRPVQMCTEGEMEAELQVLVEAMRLPDEETSDAVLHILEDLGRNVFHHGQTRGGGAHFAASFDSGSELVRLGVADCGQGIATDIRSHVAPELSDREAVEVALEPQISGSSQPDVNRGVGLYVVRRLALQARGAVWIKTGRVVVECSTATPVTDSIHAVERGEEWRGVAVAVTMKGHQLPSFRRALSDILGDLDAPLQHGCELRFFHRDNPDPAWHQVRVEPDRNKLCYERLRARALATDTLAHLLSRGARVSLDFTGTRTATQAFGHALLADVVRQYGPDGLARMRFIGCSAQVRGVLQSAARFGLAEHLVPESPG